MNKETCECQLLIKMSLWEIFDIQCIYIANLRCRPSMKSLWIFIMIRDDMTLCWCTYPSSQISILFTTLCIHYFSYPGQRRKTNLHEQFHKLTKLSWTFIMMLQTLTFQPLTSLSSWYLLFQEQGIIPGSESAKHACKRHTLSVGNSLYFLVSNIWFGYW